MSNRALTIPIILFAIALAAPAFGQGESKPESDSFTIADQPGSPLRMSIERQGLPKNSVYLKVTNNGTQPVRGYVVRVKGLERDHVHTAVFANRFLDPGASRPAGIASGYVGSDKPDVVEISLDYVGFSDGTSWGPDSLGRSKIIADYIKGYVTAKSRLAEMLEGQNGTELIRPVEMFGGHSFGEPARMSGRRDRDYFDAGYESVLIRLRQMKGAREDEAKELARRLEILQKSIPQ